MRSAVEVLDDLEITTTLLPERRVKLGLSLGDKYMLPAMILERHATVTRRRLTLLLNQVRTAMLRRLS